MCKFVNNTKQGKIDKCMKPLIEWLNSNGRKTVMCCCGHSRYKMSIVVKSYDGVHYELLTDTPLSKKRNFYKKDNRGYYYIPEVEKAKNE